VAALSDREPVAVAGGLQVILQALLALIASFGVPLTTVQQGLITTIALAVSAYWTRGKVFAPVGKDGQPIMAANPDEFAAIYAQRKAVMSVESDPESPRLAEERRADPRQTTGGKTDAELLAEYRARVRDEKK